MDASSLTKLNTQLLALPAKSLPVAPTQEDARQLRRENRVLLWLAVLMVILSGPLFTAGLAIGRLTPTAHDPGSPPAREARAMPAGVSSPADLGHSQSGSPNIATPEAGQVYLQLAATARHQPLIESLRKNGFPAFASEVPKSPTIRRVLIGPLHASDVSKVRAELQSKGFPGNAAIERKL